MPAPWWRSPFRRCGYWRDSGVPCARTSTQPTRNRLGWHRGQKQTASAAGMPSEVIMTRLMRSIAALIALVLSQTVPVAAAEQVDLLLVLSSDVSRSVDHPKFLLQREGYA